MTFFDCYDRNLAHDDKLKVCCLGCYHIAHITLTFLDETFPSGTAKETQHSRK